MRTAAGCLAQNGGTLQLLEVVAELFGSRKSPLGRQQYTGLPSRRLPGTMGKVQYCWVVSLFRSQISFKCVGFVNRNVETSAIIFGSPPPFSRRSMMIASTSPRKFIAAIAVGLHTSG